MNIEIFKKYDWFHSVGIDDFGRDVVYVNYMTAEIIQHIQSQLGNVLIYFALSKIDKNKYVIFLDEEPITDKNPYQQLFATICFLQDKYSKHIVQDIFYEIHDGKNSVTNLSANFPEARLHLEELYNSYGFDTLYKQLC